MSALRASEQAFVSAFLVHVPTVRACLACIGGIDPGHGSAGGLALVDDFRLQVTRQTYEQLEVIYRSEDISNLMTFKRVQE